MSKQEEGFLDRWSKRKRSEPEVEAVEAPQPEETESLEGLSDAEILEKLELPDPDTLKEGDDFKGFLNSAVPDHLRKRALRVLWRSNPALANLDGLLDYGEDFTDAAMVPEVLNTAYKVGRGFLKDLVEEEEDAIDEAVEDAEETLVEAEETQAEPEEIEVAATPTPEPAPERQMPRPRMRFTTG